MDWANEHVLLVGIACSLTALVLIYWLGDGISPLALVRKSPSALRLVVGGLFLVIAGNLVMWTPGLFTGLVAERWLGDWGRIFMWPGFLIGSCLLYLMHKPLLAVYRFIAGVER